MRIRLKVAQDSNIFVNCRIHVIVQSTRPSGQNLLLCFQPKLCEFLRNSLVSPATWYELGYIEVNPKQWTHLYCMMRLDVLCCMCIGIVLKPEN